MSVETILAVTLRHFAEARYLDLAWPYGAKIPAMYVPINEVLHALEDVLDNMHFQQSDSEFESAAIGFQELREFPIYGVPLHKIGDSLSS